MNINKRYVIELFNQMLAQSTVITDMKEREPGRVFIHEGFYTTLTGHTLDIFNECVDEILKDKILVTSVSRTFVEKLIIACAKECIEQQITDANDIMRTHLAIFDAPPADYEFRIAIDNLTLHGLSLILGDVRISTFDTSTFHHWVDKYAQYKHFTDIASHAGQLENKPVACVQVSAFDKDQAQNIAKQRIEDALDILRWAGRTAYSLDSRAWIGLSGRIFRQHSLPALLESDKDGLTMPRNSEGAQLNFGIIGDIAERFHRMGVHRIGRILVKPLKVRTDLEKRLMTALRFHGKSVQETDPIDAFLNATTVLECLLIKDNNEPIIINLADRTAFLLGEQREQRLQVRNDVKRLYSTRSAITHHGSVDGVIADLSTIQDIAYYLIYRFVGLTDKFDDLESLVKWLDELKFS
ncbi:hypothetical protein [Alicyclobacillus fodiniaquatilis]|uniref:Apea-like HEPN domain-containing protein n=1 Tax=Alicyclobacillus fodiniaquatilis TaxID=1661150 RepID=A0ABW4JG30_9BACL